MDPLTLGALAGLGAAALWSFSSLLFTFAGHAIGSMMVNRWRLVFATLILIAVHTLLFRQPIPLSAGYGPWLWLALSALVGLVIGDSLLFRSYLIIGPRNAMVLMTLSPVFSTVLAWVFLGEVLNPSQLLGIGITGGGVAWAISHHPRIVTSSSEGTPTLGILLGIGAGCCQAAGLILARKGMPDELSTISANVIRIGSAMVLIWLMTLLAGKFPESTRAIRHKRAGWQVAVGSLIGPTIGVWLSLVAVKYAPVGVASSLMSTTPILMIPLSALFLKEHIRLQSIVGTLVAVSGVVLLLTSG